MTPILPRPQLHKLAMRLGISPEFADARGKTHVATHQTLEAIIQAMDFDSSTEFECARSLSRLTMQQRGLIVPPVVAIPESKVKPLTVQVQFPRRKCGLLDWHVECRPESGDPRVWHGAFSNRMLSRSFTLELPIKFQLGYYDLTLMIGSLTSQWTARQRLIVHPPSCWTVEQAMTGRRAFGLWANVYSVKCRDNWGIGDFRDLGSLVQWAANRGASFVGVNPLHATINHGVDISPYSPISRLFDNLVYLDIKVVPEFASCPKTQVRVRSPEFVRAMDQLHSARRLDYAHVARAKVEVLRALYTVFVRREQSRNTPRARLFERYCAQQGRQLTDFAVFQALLGAISKKGRNCKDWQKWPEGYQDPRSDETAVFQREHAEEVDFYRYVQFELDRQKGQLQSLAAKSGMCLGIYHDLALGSSTSGFDTWCRQDLFLRSVHVGAPPDSHSDNGQDWSLPPISPRGLLDDRFEYWRKLLSHSMRHAGMLRIDHVMGLFRQYWIPAGFPANQGTYVRYPSKELLGILALESVRNKCVIVGEDLGTVPRGLPRTLSKWGILSSRVLYFERTKKGSYRPASAYPRRCLVTASTHDHVPLAGFLNGADLDLRQALALLGPRSQIAEARKQRRLDQQALIRRLVRDRLLPRDSLQNTPPLEELISAVHRFLSKTPCALLGISLDDLAGEEQPVNLPGIPPSIYPSWVRKMKTDLQEIMATVDANHFLGGVARRGSRSSRSA